MNRLPRYLLPLALLLTACAPQAPDKLSPEAAAEFIEMSESLQTLFDSLPGKPFFSRHSEQEEQMLRAIREQEELLQQYAETGNARLRTPLVHQTMLHLAVQYRKEALVRQLLQQGADPNATCDYSVLNLKRGEMDAPLAWTVVPEITKEEMQSKPFRETAIRLINILKEAGARMDDDAGGHALFMCSLAGREDAEDVYLHLLSCGANPRLGYMNDKGEDAYLQQAVCFVLRHPWERALTALINKGHIPVDFRDNEQKTLLFAQVEKLIYLLRSGDDCYASANNEQEWKAALREETQRYLRTIHVLLENGADPNAPQGGGWTPLNYAAAITPQEMLPGSIYTDKAAALAAWQELISLLLQHGGDVNADVPAHAGKPPCKVCELLPAAS